jgi:sortase A
MRRLHFHIEWLCFLIAAVCLGYCAWVLLDSRFFQNRELQELERPGQPHSRLKEGELLGQILIPRLGVSSVILEGTGDTTLRRAIGHVPGTALPGHGGNICLAGHRDHLFRPLREIAAGDEVRIRTSAGTAVYRVVDTDVVTPQQTDVLNRTHSDTLTLITCYPFNFIGSAPERFVVRARAEREKPTE